MTGCVWELCPGVSRNCVFAVCFRQLSVRFDEICCCHGNLPVNPDRIGQLIRGSGDVMQGRIRRKSEDLFGRQFTAFDLGFCTLLCDPGT